MKKSILLTLLVLGFKCAFCQYSGSIITNQNDIVYKVSNSYDVIWLQNCEFNSELGAPQMPIMYKKYVIPYDATVSGITITSSVKTELQGSYNIYPVQPPAIPDGRPASDFVEPLPSIYQSMTPYPNITGEIKEVNFFMDYKIVTVAFHPIEYQPLTRKLFLYTNIGFTINYTITSTPYTFSKQISWSRKQAVQELVASCVENPGDVLIVSGGVNDVPDNDVSDFYPTTEQYPTNLGVKPDYLIITTNAFVTKFQDFISWKNKKGIPVVLATLEDDILKKYSGCDSAHKIRNFIADMRFKFGPGLLILLGGDINTIPTRMARCNGIESPCDLYYASAFLDDVFNWNADGDQLFGEQDDLVYETPDNFIGRIPVRKAADVLNFANKVLEYEKLMQIDPIMPIDPGFRNHLLELIGTSTVHEGDTGWKDAVMESINTQIPISSTMPLTMLNDTPPLIPIPNITEIELNKANAITELNKPAATGYNICIHYDHSGPATMGTSSLLHHEKLFIPDVLGLTNTHANNILLSIGCATNMFSENSISKAFLNNTLGGSLVFIGKSVSTGYGLSETGNFIHRVFYDNSTILNHAATYFATTYQNTYTRRQFNMLGDPELPIWKNDPPVPPTMTANVTSLETGPNPIIITINGLPAQQNARLCISKPDEVYFTDIFTGTGATVNRSITIKPETTGVVDIVLSIKNYLPVQMQLTVTANPEPNLHFIEYVINDTTFGNSNSQLDAGEKAGIRVRIKNSGSIASGTIYQALLVSLNSNCTVNPAYRFSGFQSVPPVNADPGVLSDPLYGAEVATNVDDQAYAKFNLILPVQNYPACTTSFIIPVHAPKIKVHTIRIANTSNNNTIIEKNEDVDIFITLRNEGSGLMKGVHGMLSSDCNYIWPVYSASAYPDINGFAQAENVVKFTFHVSDNWDSIAQPPQRLLVKLNLTTVPQFGPTWEFPAIDLTPPAKPTGLKFTSSWDRIKLWWTPVANAKGYNVYRSKLPETGFEKQNYDIIEGISCYNDLGLQPNSVFYYLVSAVSKDGMEGPQSDLPALKAWTTLPLHPGGWPITNINPVLGFSTSGSPMTEDINRDGKKEVFLNIGDDESFSSEGGLLGFTSEGDTINGYGKANGAVKPFYRYQHAGAFSTPAIVDIDNDGRKEIIVTTREGGPGGDGQKTMVFSTSQIDQGSNPHLKWDYNTSRDSRGATVASIDGDENYEIAVKGDWSSNFYSLDKTGTVSPGWPVGNLKNLNGNGTPVLADIDLDGQKEFIIGLMTIDSVVNEAGIYAWTSTGNPYTGTTGLFYRPSPQFPPVYRMDAPLAVANINEDDDYPEIICVAADKCIRPYGEWCQETYIPGRVFILDHNGECIPGWGYEDHIIQITNHQINGAYGLPSPSVADINGDGHLEIVIAGYQQIYAWDNTGTALPNFPIDVTGLDPQFITPLLADVDNDDQVDIIVASSSDTNEYSGIFAFKQSGAPVIGFPLHIGKVWATPCIDDIDNDGKPELIASSGPIIYAWDCDGKANNILWGKTRLNTANNAVYDNRCDLSSNPVTIHDNPIWTVDRFVGGVITIPAGESLTIKSKINFSSTAQIIVQPGGKLFVDHGTLTSSCVQPWGGIKVNGNSILPQTPNSNQGYVRIFNNSVIEKANPAIQSENGGIILASDVEFKNNQRSVILTNYPSFKNISTLTRCHFVIDDKTILSGNEYFIGAQYINPLAVYGCSLENKIPFSDVDVNLRGTGIMLSNANLVITATSAQNPGPDPLEVKTTIKGLHYGIYSLGSLTRYTSSIMYTHFEENLRGLYQSGYNGISYNLVAKNSFKVLRPEIAPGLKGYGMYLNSCSGYTVEENDFYSEGTTPAGTGLIINESGSGANQIYNNKFHNLDQGSKPQGQNRLGTTNGLCYRCNDFYDNNNDIFILSDNPGFLNQGIATQQGDDHNPASNTFTSGNTSFWDIYNLCDNITYYHHEHANNFTIIPDPKYRVTPSAVSDAWYNKNQYCPSHFNGGLSSDELKTEMKAIKTSADSVTQLLDQLIDGGSTEVLNIDVQLSTPPEAFQTLDQLLGESPYLSDTVMKSAIAKEDVLNNVMVRDILVANPQSAKTIQVVEALEERFIPMPDSLMADIMDGVNIMGDKETKEGKLLSLNQKYSQSFGKLVRWYEEEMTGGSAYDSVVALLSNEESLNARYDLVSILWQNGEFYQGEQVLDSIPLQFELSEAEAANHACFESLFDIMEQINTDSLMLQSIDSAQVAMLDELYQNNFDLPGTYARNLLQMTDNLQYSEPILDPDPGLKMTKIYSHRGSRLNGEPFFLKLYPNPAHHYFVVEYSIGSNENQSSEVYVSISDMKGNTVSMIHKDKPSDSFIIPIGNIPTGSYTVSLKTDGIKRVTRQIIIVK